MQRLKSCLLKLAPTYGWAALFVIIAVNCVVYYGSRIFTRSMYHYNLTSRIDEIIPFVPAFIMVYIVVAYLQWGFGYFLSAREEKKTVAFIFLSEIAAKLLCLLIFFLIPTTMIRAEINGTGVFERLVGLVYLSDSPDNLLPSIHCLESYLLWRTMSLLKRAPAWYKKITPVISLLVFISVLLVKQHVIVDIVGAIAVTEIGMLFAKMMSSLFHKSKMNKCMTTIE